MNVFLELLLLIGLSIGGTVLFMVLLIWILIGMQMVNEEGNPFWKAPTIGEKSVLLLVQLPYWTYVFACIVLVIILTLGAMYLFFQLPRPAG